MGADRFPHHAGRFRLGFRRQRLNLTADVLVPVFGYATQFTYVDPQFIYHNNDGDFYTGSVGVGERWLTSSAGILGAYVFGDYNRTAQGNEFWFVSPGVEHLGVNFDFSANLYIPVSNQKVNTGTEFADEAGDFNDITFSGHNQYDQLVNGFESTGWGGDAELGYRIPIPLNPKVYLGGYYFAQDDADSIKGVTFRAEIPVNQYIAVLASEAYDNVEHNTVKAGVTIWFGGRQTSYNFNGDLATRMVDPISPQFSGGGGRFVNG